MSMSRVERIEAEKLALQEWLESLKVGDEVALPKIDTIVQVSRRTPTMIIVGEHPRESRFSADTGRAIGGSPFSMIKPVTQEIRDRFAAKSNRERIRNETRFCDRLTDAEVVVMLAALDAHRAAQEAPGGES